MIPSLILRGARINIVRVVEKVKFSGVFEILRKIRFFDQFCTIVEKNQISRGFWVQNACHAGDSVEDVKTRA